LEISFLVPSGDSRITVSLSLLYPFISYLLLFFFFVFHSHSFHFFDQFTFLDVFAAKCICSCSRICSCIFGAYINSISVERTSEIAKCGAGRVLCFKNVVKVDTNHEGASRSSLAAEANKKPEQAFHPDISTSICSQRQSQRHQKSKSIRAPSVSRR